MPPVLWTALYADPVDVAIGVALLCALVASPAADLLPGLPDQGSLAVALTTVTMIAMVALLVRPLVVTLRERVGAARRATYSLRAAQAALAHDLRTPLTSICALGALTEERLEATPAGELPPPGAIEAARGYAARIVELGWRAEHTIRSVLELSQAGEAELDTSEFDVRAMLEQLASETPGVALVVDDVPARILAHEASIRRVFANLLENAARHATPAGARRDGDANAVARVTVRGRTLPTGWSFDVVDDGPGIDEAEAELLFEPWRRGATASDGGSGLGLAIVAAIVDQHGGTIGAGNASGAGARFSFSIRRLH
jgi:signal transduction histidine kinase